MFQPDATYDILPEQIHCRDFSEYREWYVVRPPYQRKNVWSVGKQQALLDSLFRGYYIPRLVLRQVKLGKNRIVREVVDGQQRIVTVQRFFANELALPKSLDDVSIDLAGRRFGDLGPEMRSFANRGLRYDADLIKGIDDPRSPEHQEIATEIFWRLQQGESLNFMEQAHARLSSLLRNFLVKYADDITFDYDAYVPVSSNPHKHDFFALIERSNDRMQHLSLLGRLLLIERAGGATELRDALIGEWIEETMADDGIGNDAFDKTPEAQSVLATLALFHRIFAADPMLDSESGVQELRTEYFIISMVMLLRHLRLHYALSDEHHALFREFVVSFHQRWKDKQEDDRNILVFSDNRQLNHTAVAARDRITRQSFFEFASQKGKIPPTLDPTRTFNEADRIKIYREQDGLCQVCLEEGKPTAEAQVSWSEFQADHITAWSKGGPTQRWNGQVLCRYHNTSKGAG